MSRGNSVGEIKPHTLRHWLIEAGKWSVAPRKLRHRRWRERKAALGELVQMDTSIHLWLEGRSKESIVLIAMIDDATSTLTARFARSDSGRENRSLIVEYLKRFGRMRALYTDRASHFSSQTTKRALLGLAPLSSTINRALEALDIELITALSPQAKGRVERLFGTLQDRLLKELRVADIASLSEANRFLEETFLPFWNRTFTAPAREKTDAHRPMPEAADLQEIFAEKQPRRINPDFTVRFENTYYQISQSEAKPSMPGATLDVSRRLDGKLSFKWRGEKLNPTALPGLRASPSKAPRQSQKPNIVKPAKNHPWRASNMLFAVKH